MLNNTASKDRVLSAIRAAYPNDLSIKEVSVKAGLSRPTASTWLKVLHAEGRIVISRRVGNAVFYKLKVK